MYLARIYLNSQRGKTRRAMGNVNRLHAQILNTMGPSYEGNHPLWRIDSGKTEHVLYVVSGKRPDMTAIHEDYGWEDHPAAIVDYTPRLDALKAGETWAFRLTANPVHNVRLGSNDAEGKLFRVAHETAEFKTKWLAHRGTMNGFALEGTPTVSPNVRHRFAKSGEKSTEQVTIDAATFEGFLTVTDADRFRTGLTTGIGRAKAYGCGLLTIAPL